MKNLILKLPEIPALSTIPAFCSAIEPVFQPAYRRIFRKESTRRKRKVLEYKSMNIKDEKPQYGQIRPFDIMKRVLELQNPKNEEPEEEEPEEEEPVFDSRYCNCSTMRMPPCGYCESGWRKKD